LVTIVNSGIEEVSNSYIHNKCRNPDLGGFLIECFRV
jgi:hypothetical protein